jgi:hypothetical protein
MTMGRQTPLNDIYVNPMRKRQAEPVFGVFRRLIVEDGEEPKGADFCSCSDGRHVAHTGRFSPRLVLKAVATSVYRAVPIYRPFVQSPPPGAFAIREKFECATNEVWDIVFVGESKDAENGLKLEVERRGFGWNEVAVGVIEIGKVHINAYTHLELKIALRNTSTSAAESCKETIGLPPSTSASPLAGWGNASMSRKTEDLAARMAFVTRNILFSALITMVSPGK